MTKFWEVLQTGDREFSLQDPDSEESLVTISFSQEAQLMLQVDIADVVQEMIGAGLELVSESMSESNQKTTVH